jgi:hypothetical protein
MMETTQNQSDAAQVLNRGQPRQTGTPAHHPSPPPVPQSPVHPGPLDESDFLLIHQAAVRRKSIRGATRTALTSSVATLFIGISAIPFVLLWPGWLGGLAATGLCIIGVVEYKGYRRMRQADPTAARMLGMNQLALLALIVLYCLTQMVTFSSEQAKAAAISPEVRSQLAALPSMAKAIDSGIDRLVPLATYGLYGLIILLSAAFQGGMAAYYFTRRRHLEAFNTQTPPWVRRVFVETAA